MFRKISYRIALQFTAFVFLLFLVNGALFLLADIGNAQRQTRFRLERMSHLLTEEAQPGEALFPGDFPPPLRDRMRILDAQGNILFSGGLFSGVPFSPRPGFSEQRIQNDDYAVLTVPLQENGRLVRYAQMAEIERLPRSDLPIRAFLYLLVSAAISALTFSVGLFFARRSLLPAEQMMQRLEQFTQDASHELRTPLSVLSSSLDLALRTKKYREGIVSAKEDLKQVAVLVERLLELARLDKFVLERKPIRLSTLVAETVEKHRPLAEEKHVALQGHLAPHVTAEGDALLLRQVIGNLLSNAIKFTKPGGRIDVTLAADALSVTDTGIGIAKDALPHIFNRFYQAETSRSGEGFGLGLALVKRIVDLHGWTIGVESAEGKGTTFTVRFAASSRG